MEELIIQNFQNNTRKIYNPIRGQSNKGSGLIHGNVIRTKVLENIFSRDKV